MSPSTFGPGCPWYGMYETWGPPNVKWCEQTLCAVVNEPANTWSNLAFMIPAALYWVYHRRRGERDMSWLALSGFIMGGFSLMYHATNNALTQYFDFLGMYLFVFFMIAMNLMRLLGLDRRKLMVIYGLAVIGVTAATPLLRQIGFPIQAIVLGSVAALVLTEYLSARAGSRPQSYRAYGGLAASYAVAITSSALDVTRTACDPHNHFLQGHAMWHVFGAVGMVFAFHHYRTIQQRSPVLAGTTPADAPA